MSEFWRNLRDFWARASVAVRATLLVSMVLIVAMTATLWIWSARSNYQVLFSDLETRDAAAIVDELKKMKVAYQLTDSGTKILVDGKAVHETRLELMSRDLSISGGVGFEIFDKQDVGMTESMQRINYQRALQGELARTILANDQLKSARVHLVVEEGGLFSRDKAQPKAAVSVVLKPNARLGNDQITGIQRLVAAAVQGLDPTQVTITDQRGIALSIEADAETDTAGVATGGKLRLKKQADEYLTRKVSEVLDRAFGPGQAIVSVDATLNFDQVQRSQQSIVPLSGRDDAGGAVVRRRESVYRAPTGATAVKAIDSSSDTAGTSNGTLTSTNEVEYEFGKSAEQVLSTPGGIRRISIGVIVPQPLTDDQLGRLREVVGMAVGFNLERGDAITVQPLSRLLTPPSTASRADTEVVPATRVADKAWQIDRTKLVAAVFVLVLLFGGVVITTRRQNGNEVGRRLSTRERLQLLSEIKSWVDADKTVAGRSKP